MQINTDLIPAGPYRHVVVLIDVLRTCTVAPLLFDRGASQIELTPSLRRALAAGGEGRLLVGERQGVPPEGFNYGNSPAQLAKLDMTGRQVVMVSENAPRWLGLLGDADEVLLGSLINAAAVADLVAGLEPQRVDLVCAGFAGEPDLDDSVAAALIAALLQERMGAAEELGATRFATTLLRALPGPLEALWRSLAGRYLRGIGLEQDLAIAARISTSSSVPRLAGQSPGEPAPLYRFVPSGA